MGVCCSCHIDTGVDGHHIEEQVANEREVEEEEDIVVEGDAGARVLLRGSSKYVSMFTRQGKKGVNQDAMTAWESFSGDKDMYFCAVFDGHGPSGHKVARYIRDHLPSKLSMPYKQSSSDGMDAVLDVEAPGDDADQNPESQNPYFLLWKARLRKGFMEMDQLLGGEKSIDSYRSGTTTVCVLKKGEHLMIANLGDSRAILCTTDGNGRLVPEQLTVDLKPSVPSEAERIRERKGRVMAMEEEPHVYRVWMPDEDSPGLAMARAFGDFCLKDYGVISTPQVSYRKITEKDEFVVLATDGIWDALSNEEVIKIVASARERSAAAKKLVETAIRAWRYKYPRAKIDDCAVVCLFFKRQHPGLTKSYSEVSQLSLNYTELEVQSYAGKSDDALDTVLNMTASPEGGEVEPGLTRPRKRRPTRKFKYMGD